MNQTCVKIFPALATGCTMILKPPQLAPYSAQILAEILARRRRAGGRVQHDPGLGQRDRHRAVDASRMST